MSNLIIGECKEAFKFPFNVPWSE